MGALADFLAQYRVVAVPAIPAIRQSAQFSTAAIGTEEPQEPQEPRDVLATLRAHLLILAAIEGIDKAMLHRLNANDVAACVGESDDTLRAYVRGLEHSTRMDEGRAPFGWNAIAHCAGCGPVWWHQAESLKACPWCFKRNAGRSIPSPPVRCGYCRHYEPDGLNPRAGRGECTKVAGRGRWAMQSHACAHMQPVPSTASGDDSLMISISKKFKT